MFKRKSAMKIDEAALVIKVVKVFNSCQTRAQFDVAKNFATRAAVHFHKDLPVELDVLKAFYDARQRTANKV